MLILPKKYIDEIDIIELKKRQLRNTKQRKSVEEAYQEYKKNYEHFYSEKAKQYIEDNFFKEAYKTSNMDILMQLYSELGLDIGKHTFYDEHLERISSIFGLDRDITEVASGYIPALANKIAKKQLDLNSGTITIYEPELFEEKSKYSNMTIHFVWFPAKSILPSFGMFSTPFTSGLNKILNKNFVIGLTIL